MFFVQECWSSMSATLYLHHSASLTQALARHSGRIYACSHSLKIHSFVMWHVLSKCIHSKWPYTYGWPEQISAYLLLIWLQCKSFCSSRMPTWLNIRWIYLSPQAFVFILTLSTSIKAQLSSIQCVLYHSMQFLLRKSTLRWIKQQKSIYSGPNHIWT